MEDRKDQRGRTAHFALALAIFIVSTVMIGGCSTQEVTSPPRSATEQLLLSTAADQAMANANLSIFSGRSVYLDFTYFDSYDSKYAEGEIRDAFSRAGALMARDSKSADVIVEARSGAYSIDTNTSFFGIPSIPLPIPGTAEEPVTPQVPFYESQSEVSHAKIALLAFDNKTRTHIYSSGPLDGRAYNTYQALLFISWWSTDVLEKSKKLKEKEKNSIWYPQYDLQNMPAAGGK
jgi:hypothetical protein